MKPSEYSSLKEILLWRAEYQAHQTAFTFLEQGEQPTSKITYAQLDQQARSIAATLQEHNLSQQRALLLIPTGLSFVAAFMGCVYANITAIPVPAHFHDPARLPRILTRLQAIAKDAQAKIVLTTDQVLPHMPVIFEQALDLKNLHWFNLEDIPLEKGSFWQDQENKSNELIFLQYSSGSTGSPKGVMVSHENLMHNAEQIRRAFEHSEDSLGVSWLPAYHDLGLVADILQPIYSGHHEILISPFDFIKRPLRWLEAISKYQATTSGAPNFAYALCLNKIRPEQLLDLDLSSWTLAYNCAEPVRAEVIKRFVAMFGPCGFQEQAFFPFLGMAECTLMVSAGKKKAPPVYLSVSLEGLKQGRILPDSEGDTQIFVGNGEALPLHQIRIVEPETRLPCQGDQVGEIWVTGPSLARGYWDKPAETQHAFQAHMEGVSEDLFLRTGDLGFLHHKQLFITGRLKDLIIIQGQNVYPQDIERTLETAHNLIRAGCSAAFSVPSEESERLIIVAEVQDLMATKEPETLNEILLSIQTAIFSAHQLRVSELVLIRSGTLPKTSSGKVQRKACQQLFQSANLAVVNAQKWSSKPAHETAYNPPNTAIEAELCHIFEEVLALPRVSLQDNFLDLGGHSLQATQLIGRIREQMQVELHLRELFENPSIGALAALIEKSDALQTDAIQPIQREGAMPLSFAQERLWFLNQLHPGDYAYNMPAAVELIGPLDIQVLKQSLFEILQRHESLRTQFSLLEDGRPEQTVQTITSLDIELIDLNSGALAERKKRASQLISQEAKVPFDLEQVPLLRAKVYQLTPLHHVLFINMHHIVSDGWSMGLFFWEFSNLYHAYARGESSPLMALPVQYIDYALWQRALLTSGESERQLCYWKNQLSGLETLNLPTDYPRLSQGSLQGARLTIRISDSVMVALKQLAKEHQASLFMVLLSAFNILLYRYTDQTDIAVGSPIAGRKTEASERLIGFFVNTLVLRSQIQVDATFSELVEHVKQVALAAYAHQDLPFEKIVEACNPDRDHGKNPLFQILFALQNTPYEALDFKDLQVQSFPFETETTRMDLELQLWERENGLDCQLIFNTDLFESWRMQRMLSHFEALLETVSQDPEQHILDLSPWSEWENQQKIQERQRFSQLMESPQIVLESMLSLFQKQKESNPRAIAVQTGDQTLNYVDLDKKSTHLALSLKQIGLEHGSDIGVCLDNSINLAIALVGLLKGGYIAVPLPQQDTCEEKEILLQHSQIKLALSDPNQEILFEQFDGSPVPEKPSHFEPSVRGETHVRDPVIRQYCWNARADLIAWPYTQEDILAHLEKEPSVKRVNPLELDIIHWLDLWCKLLSGARYDLERPVPIRFGSDLERRYHLMDLDPHFNFKLSSRLTEVMPIEAIASDAQEPQPEAYVNGGELIYPEGSPKTVIEAILQASSLTHVGMTVINQLGEALQLSYAQLIESAKCICQGLQDLGLEPNDAVVLQCEQSEDHFAAFLGAVLGGFIPITVAIPPLYQNDHALVQKLLNVLTLFDQPFIICNQSNQVALLSLSRESAIQVDKLLTVEALKQKPLSQNVYHAKRDEIVFYQLSSGSTGVPKCIQITHKGIIAHCEAAGQINAYSPQDVWLNWIPLDHVVPILTWFLQALYQKGPFIHVNTEYILTQPLRWLRLMEEYQVKHSWSPNFGFKLISDELKKRPVATKYDLSGVKSLMNAGEQVTSEVLKNFIAGTQKFGLSENVLNPAFGMAESCTCMTYDVHFELEKTEYYLETEAQGFINTGAVIPGVEIRIVNSENTLLSEKQIGRFQIRGEVITPGYYKNAPANLEAFVGLGWFNTGDLGFIYQGNLYITGREKEMIVVRGANIYCYEIEDQIGTLEGVVSTYVGVFPLVDEASGSEGFGVAYVPESNDCALDIIKDIKKKVTERLGIVPGVVIPIPKADFPKTTSGKIQRSKLAQDLIGGTYDHILKEIDVLEAHENTIPDGFYQAGWHEMALIGPKVRLKRKFFVLLTDNRVLARQFEDEWAISGLSFRVLTPDAFQDPIRQLNLIHFDEIVVLFLGSGDRSRKGSVVNADFTTDFAADLTRDLALSLKLAQLFFKDPLKQTPLSLVYLHDPTTQPREKDTAYLGSLQGFLNSFQQERLQTRTQIIECDHLSVAQIVKCVSAEIGQGFGTQQRIRYDHQKRFVRKLEPVSFYPKERNTEAFQAQSLSLILGGLGGIGYFLAQEILSQPQQSVIIVGRSAIPADLCSEALINPLREKAFARLKTIAQEQGNTLSYLQCDLEQDSEACFQQKLQAIEKNYPLRYIIQCVADHYQEALIQDLDSQNFIQQLSFKIKVTQMIQSLLEPHSEIHLIDIGSVNGYFGGFQVSGYASAQGFIDGLSEYYRSRGIRYHCLNQTLWEHTGLSQGKENQGINKGFVSLNHQSGIPSIMALLKKPDGVYYIGLNGKKDFVCRQLARSAQQRLVKKGLAIPVIDEILDFNMTNHQNLTLHVLNRRGDRLPQGIPGFLSLNKRLKMACQKIETGLAAQGLRDGSVLLNPANYYGFHLNLSLIEAKIRQASQCSEIYLALVEKRSQEKAYVAFVSLPKQTEKPHPEGLQQQVLETIADCARQTLPWHMRPSRYMLLDELPLTPQGEVDRAALSAQYQSVQTSYQAPESELERSLCLLYAEVLGLSTVSRTDDFFYLGGHSLLATQLVARIRDLFAIELPLKALFEGPTVAALATQVQRSQKTSMPAIMPLVRDRSLRLSFAQERLWFMDQLQPNSTLYSTPFTLRLEGYLNRAILEQSLQILVQRHESLRTQFVSLENQPTQLILEQSLFQLTYLDLSQSLDPEKEAQSLTQANAEQSFDLGQDALLRVALLKLTEDLYYLNVNIHHIISDGWSVAILLAELCQVYTCLINKEPLALPDLAIQYVDYAYWQRQWFESAALQPQVDYWKSQLANAPAVLALPTDRPRPALETYQGGKDVFQLEETLKDQLIALSQKEGVTLFMLLLTAFQVLLHRYSQQTDISVGIPIANRRLKELEPLIGLFVNTLVIRGNLSDSPSFASFLQHIKVQCLEAYAHQDLPFEKLVEVLNPERSMSHHPLFQVMFLLQENTQSRLDFAGLKSTLLKPNEGLSKFDITLELELNATGLSGRIEYNRDLFNSETIGRLSGHYQRLLQSIVDQPESKIGHLEMLTAQEQQQLIIDWNQTTCVYPKDKCIHHFFEAQVLKRPHKTVLVFEDRALTYSELNHRANQLAHYLMAQGVGPDVLVGVSVPRSIEMLVGILAILKAGGAYVPLDPEYPIERLRFMLQDTQVSLVLTMATTQENLAHEPIQTLILDEDLDKWIDFPGTNPQIEFSLERLISIIYTSGSTGQPKGVMNTHLGVYNHLMYRQSAYQMTSEDKIIQKTSINFDGSVWELFWPLMVGATLYFARPEGHKDSVYLAQFIQHHQITMVDFVPSMLQAMLQEPLPTDFSSLRRVWCGGESLTYALQEAFFERYDIALTHGYGPTETTVSVTYWDCQKKSALKTVPIGQPIANTQIYLLDQALNPVPIGLSGEIYIGGDGLARGYLKRPELSAEKFIANPFGPGRLYKSGDLARYLPNGAIEFLGRVDHQVKLRGFRIELGEIEALLGQHQAIQEGIVMLREDAPELRRLVAYVVSNRPKTPKPSELSAFLKTQLPEYMVPASFVFLKQFPLDINGKINRQALPSPDSSRTHLESEFIAPRTSDEIILAELFAQVLKVKEIGVHDNFFDLGGHSLLATQLAARLRNALQLELPLRKIFESPTVADLAISIHELQGQILPPVQLVSRKQPLQLSFAQERLWFIDQLEPNSALYNIPMALRLEGPLNVQALELSFKALIRRHETLRTQFKNKGRQPLQVIQKDIGFALHLLDLSSHADPLAEARLQAYTEANTPFDLNAAPLMRVKLFKLSDGVHFLLMNMHHIVSDGWSMRAINQELSQAYSAFHSGRPYLVSELAIQYVDYAYWQRAWFSEETLQAQLRYWQKQLANVPELLPLPSDRPRPAIETYRGSRVSFHYPKGLVAELRALAQSEGVTLFMLLLAAFQVLLHRYSHQTDISVGIPIANRRLKELEPLIGFFVNTLVIRGDLSETRDFRDFLQQIKARCLDAYAHQDLPFEKLVEVLNPKRSLSHHPLFQVMFVLQDMSLESFALEGIKSTPEELVSQSSRFDLTLELIPVHDGLSARVEYNQDLFEDQTIERLIGHYECLLRAIVKQPDERLNSLTLLTPQEQTQLIVDWNQTEVPFPDKTCIHQIFEQMAQRFPEACAVVYGDKQLNYREVNQKANQLARQLRQVGVGPDKYVGLCLERSPEMIIGLLGILKAGGVYVPLDPAYPKERLSFILKDAQVSVLLTQNSWLTMLPDDLDHHVDQVIYLEPEAALSEIGSQNLELAFNPQNVAYLIYTSGSTGQPKGVILEHRGLCNMITAQIKAFALDPDSRVLQHAAMGFDASISEIFMALCAGACLCIGTRAELLPGPALQQFLQIHRISMMTLPPSVLALLPHSDVQAKTNLKTILVAGEDCPLHLAETWVETGRFFNAYGPTEATVCATIGEYQKGDQVLSIGRAIANTQVYILGQNMTPVPIGITGELYIGGVGVARGYLNQPELSQEKFLPNPFCSGRLYKTGDLAKYLPNGQIQFQGRRDHQIKLRGFRIELGEIEARLQAHTQVKEAVVLCQQIHEHPALVAYLVPNQRFEAQEIETEHIEQWQALYQNTALQSENSALGSNFTGWNSSFTGQAIPLEQMRAWRDATVQRILSLAPQNIYEIGCGTGLLLSQLAPQVQSYWASDFSSTVLEQVKRLKMKNIKTLHRSADNFLNLPSQAFDTLILNSVVQYFPSVDYLMKVLKQAVKYVSPHGHIFIGDVRHLGLLKPFQASIALYKAHENDSFQDINEQIQLSLQREEELCLAPEFFVQLKATLPEIAQVEILHKRGDYDNELKVFRYDVILKLHSQETPLPQIDWIDWQASLTLDLIQQRYQDRDGLLGIRNIPHARAHEAVQTLQSLEHPDLQTKMAKELDHIPTLRWDPQMIWDLDTALNCKTKAYLSPRPDVFTAILSDQAVALELFEGHATKATDILANQPIKHKLSARLLPELKSFLKAYLPEYMLPNHYILLEKMPLTPNGKIDRQLLPVPGKSRERLHSEYVAPQTDQEILLCEIFSEVLGVESVGLHDDFFDLGGHSLLATQLASRIREQFQMNLPLRDLFEAPTVARLASKIRPSKKQNDLQIGKAPPQHPRRLSYSQDLWWTIFPSRAELEHGIQNSYAGIKLKGHLDHQALEQSLQSIIQRHEPLRTTFTNIEKRPLRVIHQSIPFQLERSEQYGIPEEKVIPLLEKAAQASFDLEKGPLIRARVYHLDPDHHLLMLSVSHLVFDGWSLKLLFQELNLLYTGLTKTDLTQNKPVKLPVLSRTYSDYVYAHRKWIKTRVIKKQLVYWLLKGKNMPVILDIPTDKARPDVLTMEGSAVSFELEHSVLQGLQDLAQKEGVTLYMILLACFQVLLYQYSGNEDIFVGTPVANRPAKETESLIGLFLNFIVLRADLSGTPRFCDHIQQVKETCLGAYANQDLPFQILLKSFKAFKTLTSFKSFKTQKTMRSNVMFNLLDDFGSDFKIGSLQAGLLPLENHYSSQTLHLILTKTQADISGQLIYSSDLFYRETIVQLTEHYQRLLRRVLKDPKSLISTDMASIRKSANPRQ